MSIISVNFGSQFYKKSQEIEQNFFEAKNCKKRSIQRFEENKKNKRNVKDFFECQVLHHKTSLN